MLIALVAGVVLVLVLLRFRIHHPRPAAPGGPAEGGPLEPSRGSRGAPGGGDPRFLAVVWFPAFLVIQILAVGGAMIVHGGGFDDCEVGAGGGSGPALLAIAVGAVALPVAWAAWQVRGRLLVVACSIAGVAACSWWLLLGTSQAC